MFLMKTLSGLSQTPRHNAFLGSGSSRQLCRHILRSGARRILVVTDKPLRDLGVVDQAIAGLIEAGVEVQYYDGVLPDPTFAQVEAGAAILRSEECDAVLAIGGGSSMDAAKIIAASGTSDESPYDWVGHMKIKHDVVKIFAIPTTSGTGSEATMGAVISDNDTHEKSIIAAGNLLPAAIALDPDLILGLPPHITAATGMDALTHGIEAYIGTWERGSRSEDARICIKLVFDHLETAVTDGANSEAREALSIAAYYGGLAINQVNVGSVHAIAHQLGGKYGIPHGQANAMVLPHVLEYSKSETTQQLAELAVLTGCGEESESRAVLAGKFIDAVRDLMQRAGVSPTSELLQAADFDHIVELAIIEGDAYPVPRLLEPEAVRTILQKVAAH